MVPRPKFGAQMTSESSVIEVHGDCWRRIERRGSGGGGGAGRGKLCRIVCAGLCNICGSLRGGNSLLFRLLALILLVRTRIPPATIALRLIC